MNIFFSFLTVLFAVLAFCVSLIKFTHFFQLNTYRAKIQFKWMKDNPSKLVPNLIFGIASILFSLLGGFSAKLFVIASMILGMVFSVPKKAKKPLVYTMRVKRLLITSAIVYAVVLAVGFIFDIGIMISAVLFLLAPIVILLANLINRPIEKAISNHYINDAKRLISSSNAKVIGITGSYGKTSVKYYLSTLLKAKYNVLMTPESYNTPMGVVMTIRKSLTPLTEIFVCEMGAKRVGEIKEICDIVNPDHGIITSVGPQHLETFKSLDNVKKTKFELADALSDGGMLFLNGNDENINSHKGERKNISYTVNGSGSYNATDVKVSEKGTTFTVNAPNGENGEFSTKLIGTHNVLNITGAIAVAHSLGISFKQLKTQVMRLESVPHRLELVSKGKDIIIDDAFNSNPSGAKAALETLSYFEGMKILLTPGMVELGEKQNELNCEFGENAALVCDYVILVGRKQTESIHQGLLNKGYPEDKIYIAASFSEAINHAYALNSHGEKKVILLENDLPDNY